MGLFLVLWAGPALAGEPADAVGVDVTRLVVYSNAESVAMGGAGLAFAAGAPGMLLSPAAAASRRAEWRAPGFGSLLLLQGRIGPARDPEDPEAPLQDLRLFDFGAAVGFGDRGAGLVLAGAFHEVEAGWVLVAEGHPAAGVSLLDQRLVVGLGPRLLGMRVATEEGRWDYFGAGFEVGALAPNLADRWNLGVTLRSGVRARARGDAWSGVEAARLPAGLIVGAGWGNLAQVGPERHPARVVADVVVDGALPDSVALEPLLAGATLPRGGAPTVTPRLGAEVDVWPERLRLRAGTSLEPSRTEGVPALPHLTGGFELRLFRLAALRGKIDLDLAWQVGVDWAPGYLRGAWLGINLWQGGRVGRPVAAPADAAAGVTPPREPAGGAGASRAGSPR